MNCPTCGSPVTVAAVGVADALLAEEEAHRLLAQLIQPLRAPVWPQTAATAEEVAAYREANRAWGQAHARTVAACDAYRTVAG